MYEPGLDYLLKGRSRTYSRWEKSYFERSRPHRRAQVSTTGAWRTYRSGRVATMSEFEYSVGATEVHTVLS